MIAYLTIGDNPSGIFSSQVIDTCKFLTELSGKRVKLIALLSIRGFWKNRKKIKEEYANSMVLPMVPKLENWRWNLITIQIIFSFLKGYSVIGRNAIPTVLAIKLKRKNLINKVIYDGRGCEYEQIKEYNVISNSYLANEIFENEKLAATASDYQLAVSKALVEYWRKTFEYKNSKPFIIPCTFSLETRLSSKEAITRSSLGIFESDIVLAYSGTISGWQSFQLMFQFLEDHLIYYQNLKVILLTQKTKEIEQLIEKFQGRVIHLWVKTSEVKNYLELADYGLLIREASITNWVASPIKFADYLGAGLKVIVNEGSIEQVISFIENHQCGMIYSKKVISSLEKQRVEKKKKIKKLAQEHYTKPSPKNLNLYKKLIESC